MNFELHVDDREPLKGAADNLSGVRAAMWEAQAYFGGGEIVAVDADTGERIARLEFEWLED